MSARILTYQSRNADPDKQWLALIESSKAGTIMVCFTAPTEVEVKEKVRRFWKREKEKAEATKSSGKSPRSRATTQEAADAA